MGTELSVCGLAFGICHRGEWGVFPSCNSYLPERISKLGGRRAVHTGIGIESPAVLPLAVHHKLPPLSSPSAVHSLKLTGLYRW